MEHLQLSHRDFTAVMAKDNVIHEFLKYHMSYNVQYDQKQKKFASEVDIDKLELLKFLSHIFNCCIHFGIQTH